MTENNEKGVNKYVFAPMLDASALVAGALQALPESLSHRMYSLIGSQNVNSPTKGSTHCLLLLMKH